MIHSTYEIQLVAHIYRFSKRLSLSLFDGKKVTSTQRAAGKKPWVSAFFFPLKLYKLIWEKKTAEFLPQPLNTKWFPQTRRPPMSKCLRAAYACARAYLGAKSFLTSVSSSPKTEIRKAQSIPIHILINTYQSNGQFAIPLNSWLSFLFNRSFPNTPHDEWKWPNWDRKKTKLR